MAADEERAKLVRNEQVKLAATWCNTVSAGCLVVGIVAPSVSLSLGALSPIGLGRAVAVALPLLATSAGLHWFGRKLLKGLRP